MKKILTSNSWKNSPFELKISFELQSPKPTFSKSISSFSSHFIYVSLGHSSPKFSTLNLYLILYCEWIKLFLIEIIFSFSLFKNLHLNIFLVFISISSLWLSLSLFILSLSILLSFLSIVAIILLFIFSNFFKSSLRIFL